MIKWFVIDDERLKNPNYIFGKKLFRENVRAYSKYSF